MDFPRCTISLSEKACGKRGDKAPRFGPTIDEKGLIFMGIGVILFSFKDELSLFPI